MLTAGANWGAKPIRGRRRLTALTVMRLINLADLQRHSLSRSSENTRRDVSDEDAEGAENEQAAVCQVFVRTQETTYSIRLFSVEIVDRFVALTYSLEH